MIPAETWAAYRDAVFDVPSGSEAGFASSFVIVTAWNPGRMASPEVNGKQDRALREELVRRGWRHQRVVGRSRDASHAEESWAIACGLEEGLELARSFGQAAIYVVRDGRLELHACDGEPPKEELGSFAERACGFPESTSCRDQGQSSAPRLAPEG